MARRALGVILIYAAVAAAFVALALPASAITVQGGNDEAWAIVNRADQEFQQVVDDFTAKAYTAETQEQLLAYRTEAIASLDAIYNEAVADLTALATALDGQIDWTILLAKDALTQDHDAAVNKVNSLTESLLPGLPSGSTTTTSTTTTTEPHDTTTTTKPRETTTTTTTKPVVTTTTTDGGSVTSTTTANATTTTAPSTTTTRAATTTTTGAGAGSGGSGASGGGGSTDVADDPALAAPPVIGDATALEGPSSEKAQQMRESRGMLSSMLAANASVALPPAVVAAGAAPFIVLEVIFRTLFESLAALLFPFLMLVVAVAILIWRESRRPSITPRV